AQQPHQCEVVIRGWLLGQPCHHDVAVGLDQYRIRLIGGQAKVDVGNAPGAERRVQITVRGEADHGEDGSPDVTPACIEQARGNDLAVALYRDGAESFVIGAEVNRLHAATAE